MYYSININQIAIATHNKNFATNLDLIDGAIIVYLAQQSISLFAKKNFVVYENEVYYRICYDNIISQLPLINIENKEVIGRRIKKLEKAGVIKFYLDKKNNNKTYFTTTELFENFVSKVPTQKSAAEDLKVDTQPTQKSVHIYDNNTNDNNITYSKEKTNNTKLYLMTDNMSNQKFQDTIFGPGTKSFTQRIHEVKDINKSLDFPFPHNFVSQTQNQPTEQPKKADFNEFWKEFCNMCKAKGSPTGEKKPAEIEYQKAVKIANHQGIMRTLEAFKDFILLAFENNKHACRWLKNIHWPDFENVIADYKQQTEILKTNLKKQGKPLPIAQKSPEKQQEEVKMKEHIQERRKSVIKHLNGDEVKFMNHIKEVLKSYFQELHKPWIDDFVFSCKDRVAYFSFTEQKHIDTVKRNFEKFEQIITREIASTDLVMEEENLKIELKLID